MRALLEPATIARAGLATAVSLALCLPRLVAWLDRPGPLGSLAVLLGLVMFVLWAFVFAWYPPPLRPVFRQPSRLTDWGLASGTAVVGALVLRWWVDPALQELTPQDYPASFTSWGIGVLFTIGFAQLFLCWAPYAFFYRLSKTAVAARTGTVLFGAGVLLVQLSSLATPPSLAFSLELVLVRLLFGSVAVHLLERGGPLLVAWWSLLLHARLLPDLLLG